MLYLYPKDSLFDLVAYTDNDYAGASLDRKSVTGGCQFLRCRLISWQCKKQTVVANSTTEAEYMAASSCCVQAKTVNGEVKLQALVDEKKVIITESTIRRDLQLEDIEGDILPNVVIFKQLSLMGVGKDFSGWKTSLFPTMMVQAQEEMVEDEAVSEEMDDSLERAATTATSLDAEQDRGNIFMTQSKETPNEPGSKGTSSGRGPRLYKVGLSTRVESSKDEGLDEEDASKHGRMDDIDANEDITLVSTHDEHIFGVNDLDGDKVIVESVDVVEQAKEVVDDITLAKAHIEVNSVVPQADKAPTPTVSLQQPSQEGKKIYYKIIRADGSSKIYLIFSHMLKYFDKEDVETLWKLVKAKHGSTRLEGDYKRVLWGDVKVMFKPHIEDEVWKMQQRYNVVRWTLFNSCKVHCLSLQSGHIYMLVEKRYPFTPVTITDMLNKKLHAGYFDEMTYQLLKLVLK
nr:putative ribonuclease H-like domain-containing protein [Tanacetum cinerariifolium]